MFTLCGYYESIQGTGVDHYITSIPDDHVKTVGDYVYVPEAMPNVIGKAALTAADTSVVSANLDAPSLTRVQKPFMEPIINAVVFGSPPESILHPLNPIPLDKNEGLRFVHRNTASGAVVEYGLVWLSDGQDQPVTGQVYTVRATAAITLSAGKWVNGALTFENELVVGKYAVVGMRARGTNLVAARLNFVGYANRPGVAAINAIGDQDHDITRFGRMGTFGVFDSLVQPTVECLGVTDSAQTFILDLLKLS